MVHVASPTIFYAHRGADNTKAIDITTQLEAVCANAQSVLGKPIRNKVRTVGLVVNSNCFPICVLYDFVSTQ